MTTDARGIRTKKQLLKLIKDLEKNPNDKVRILGDAGITAMAAGLGAGATGAIAAATGATSIFGLTTVAGWAGISISAATPIGWIVAGALASGAAAYGVSRAIRGGAMAEGRKAELVLRYKAEAKSLEARENAGSVTTLDRTAFVISLRELVEKDQLAPECAFRLIEQVEKGNIPLSEALRMVGALISEGSATPENPVDDAKLATPSIDPGAESAKVTAAKDESHKVVADRVEKVSMGLGITSGIVAAGASLAAPTGLSAIGVALGIASAPLIVSAAPIVASVATAAGVVSGGTYFYSKWKTRKTKKPADTELPPSAP